MNTPQPRRRVAAIDCGTNSIRLLIADVDESGQTLHDVWRTSTVVRLGAGVDVQKAFQAEALERTLKAVADYAQLIAEHQCTSVRFVATSATRDASNRAVFIDGVRELLGVEVEVVSGREEATLSFQGAAMGVKHAAQPILVVDLGGGSTELVVGTVTDTRSEVLQAYSMDVGCVRLTERHRAIADPAEREAAITDDVNQALSRAQQEIDLSAVRSVIGVAGTITTIAAHTLQLEAYLPERIHGASLARTNILHACADLSRSDSHALAALPYMHPGRVDVIGTGALIWAAVLNRVHESAQQQHTEQIVCSETDILDGIAWSMTGANPAGTDL